MEAIKYGTIIKDDKVIKTAEITIGSNNNPIHLTIGGTKGETPEDASTIIIVQQYGLSNKLNISTYGNTVKILNQDTLEIYLKGQEARESMFEAFDMIQAFLSYQLDDESPEEE